jgi:SH3 domain-containing YSC84-like protein 1
MGATVATASLSADILSFARSKGLYGGISLEGAVVASREGWNQAFYGRAASPTEILIRHDVRNATATKLTDAMAKAADKGTTARKKCSIQAAMGNRAVA